MRRIGWLSGLGLLVLLGACGDSLGNEESMVSAVQGFEEALWAGNVETALTFVTDDFSYRYPGETISNPEELRAAFGHGDHGPEGEIRIESASFNTDGSVLSWDSIRYFPGSFGQAASLSATFQGDLIAEISETGGRTTANDAIGCEESFPYSWHADYGPDATGVSDDPVTAAVAGFPEAKDTVAFEQLDQDIEAPMSGGHGPVVRASADGYTVGLVFLTEAGDGSLLVDGATGCDGYLESAMSEEDHGDEIRGEG